MEGDDAAAANDKKKKKKKNKNKNKKKEAQAAGPKSEGVFDNTQSTMREVNGG